MLATINYIFINVLLKEYSDDIKCCKKLIPVHVLFYLKNKKQYALQHSVYYQNVYQIKIKSFYLCGAVG